jgi:prefoldin subunit 5
MNPTPSVASNGESEPTAAKPAVIYQAPIRVGAVGVTFPAAAAEPEPRSGPSSPRPTTPPTPTAVAEPRPALSNAERPPRSGLGWRGCVLSLLLLAMGIVLGAGLALSVLFAINGTLDFGHHERLIYLNSWVTDLDQRVETARTELEGQDAALKATQAELETLRTRLDEGLTRLEALNTGLSNLADQAEALSRDLQETTERMADLEADVTTVIEENTVIRRQFEDINGRLTALSESAARFRDFLVGLQTLLNGLVAAPVTTAPPPAGQETAPMAVPADETGFVTGSPTLTLFPPLTPIRRPAAGQSHVFGLVWRDANGNGLPEAGETAVVGALVVLTDPEGRRLAAAVTGADGRYLFADLTPGAYVVTLPDAATSPVSLMAGADEAVEVNIGLMR